MLSPSMPTCTYYWAFTQMTELQSYRIKNTDDYFCNSGKVFVNNSSENEIKGPKMFVSCPHISLMFLVAIPTREKGTPTAVTLFDWVSATLGQIRMSNWIGDCGQLSSFWGLIPHQVPAIYATCRLFGVRTIDCRS